LPPLLQARIANIWAILDKFVSAIAVQRVDYHAFRLMVTLVDGSTIRINEQYYRNTLEQYAYYWLDSNNNLIVGWDNAPHHINLPGFPHHKHVGAQSNRQPSSETRPEEILAAIQTHLSQPAAE
jgi:hypothetical protein